MSAGKPILAKPVRINNDIVLPGKNGFLCDSEQDWYTAFCTMIEDEILREKMGIQGRELMLEKYGLDVCAVQLIKSLRGCIYEYEDSSN